MIEADFIVACHPSDLHKVERIAETMSARLGEPVTVEGIALGWMEPGEAFLVNRKGLDRKVQEALRVSPDETLGSLHRATATTLEGIMGKTNDKAAEKDTDRPSDERDDVPAADEGRLASLPEPAYPGEIVQHRERRTTETVETTDGRGEGRPGK